MYTKSSNDIQTLLRLFGNGRSLYPCLFFHLKEHSSRIHPSKTQWHEKSISQDSLLTSSCTAEFKYVYVLPSRRSNKGSAKSLISCWHDEERADDLKGQQNSSLSLPHVWSSEQRNKKEHEFGLQSAPHERGTHSKIVTDGPRGAVWRSGGERERENFVNATSLFWKVKREWDVLHKRWRKRENDCRPGIRENSQPVTDTHSIRFLKNAHPSVSEKGNCNHFKKEPLQEKGLLFSLTRYNSSSEEGSQSTRSKSKATVIGDWCAVAVDYGTEIHEGEDVVCRGLQCTGDQIRRPDVDCTFQRWSFLSPLFLYHHVSQKITDFKSLLERPTFFFFLWCKDDGAIFFMRRSLLWWEKGRNCCQCCRRPPNRKGLFVYHCPFCSLCVA